LDELSDGTLTYGAAVVLRNVATKGVLSLDGPSMDTNEVTVVTGKRDAPCASSVVRFVK
jgi:hypothetical protein